MSRQEDGDFLARWSRRKRLAGEAEPTRPDQISEPLEEAAAAQEETTTDAEILEELGLPDPDSLRPGDDFSAFMAKAVPARLRNRALRRLWLTDPVLANLDELVDYGEDFTDAATVVENLATAWQAGKGYSLPDPEPDPAEDDPQMADEVSALPSDEPVSPEDPSNQPGDDGLAPLPEEVASPAVTEPAHPAPEHAPASRPRRMRFAVNEPVAGGAPNRPT